MRSESSQLPEKFGNFELFLERIFAPAGVKNPPTADYRLLLAVQAGRSREQQRFYISIRELPELDIEQYASGCIYRSDEEKKLLIAYIRKQAALYFQEELCGQYAPATGWYKDSDGRSLFCAGSVMLSATYTEGQQNDWALPNAELHFAHHGSCKSYDISDMAPQFLQSLWEYPEYRIPAYAYTIYSHLRSRWNEVDLPFASVLFIVGKSDTGKTTLARNYCQLYNDASQRVADEWDAKSTKAALSDILYEARDRPVLYEDVCKSSNRADQNKRRDNAVELLRLVANESVQTKKSGKTNIVHPCRSGLVVTSEVLPEEWSELTRCILLQVEKFYIGGTNNDRVLAAGMLEAYLRWFAQHGEEEFTALRQQQAAFVTNEYPGFTRLYTSVLQLNWCFDSFMRFLETLPACRPYFDQQRTQEINQIFKTIFVREMHMINKIRQSWLPLEEQILTGIKSQELPYIMHKGHHCVRFDDLMAFLNQYARNSGLSTKKVSTYLRENHLIDIDASDRVSKKINGKRYVFLNIKVK